MTKRLFALCTAIILTACVLTPANAATVGGEYISSEGACVMDYDTGEILYSYNGNIPRVPASMTKIMNMYCVYEALASGEISLDTLVPISKNVYDKSRNSVYQSVLPLYNDASYTVDELIDVVVVYSASGAAVALAELVGGGSESAFVERMNKKAAEMGIDAYYYDSCGIADNELSPIAMATLARNIIRDYPDILVRSSKKSVQFHGNSYKSTNHLFDTYSYAGADGLKTGTTPAAGYCFCGTAVRNGRRMISVTMRSSSAGQRFVDTARLLDYGFSVASDKYDSIYYTDMRTFINGTELPTFVYNGITPHAVIIAEDLASCGFDTFYNAEDKTLTVHYNSDKPINPIAVDSYKNRSGEKAFSTVPTGARIIFDLGGKSFEPHDIYCVDGYICLSVDEFANIYDFVWNGEQNAAYITVEQTAASLELSADSDETGQNEANLYENKANLYETADDIKINIDGNYEMTFPDQQPVIIDGHTMVPIRALMETLEKTVEWDAEKRQTIISDSTTTVRLTVDSDVMIKEITNPINGTVRTMELKLEKAPTIINERTCLPLRAVVEAFDCTVIWEQETKTILIIAGVC